ncbi:hypothetical protein ACVWYO_001421 [Sphingomonas sp. UYP23]
MSRNRVCDPLIPIPVPAMNGAVRSAKMRRQRHAVFRRFEAVHAVLRRFDTRWVLALELWLIAAPALADPPRPAAPPSISLQTLKDVTRTLSSDAFEGRKPATPAETKTTDYIVARFKAAGLEPANNDSWFQPVPVVQLTPHDVSPMVFSGGTSPVSLQYREDMVLASFRVTPEIVIKDSPVVFVGYGITAPELGWDDYAGTDVHGKTVIILVNDPDWRSPTRTGLFEGKVMTYYGRWSYKLDEAARHGATAALIVHDTEPAGYGWNVLQSTSTGPLLEPDDTNGHADQSQAIGWMQLAKAKALFASAGKDFDGLSAAAAIKGFRAVPLGVSASVSFANTINRQTSKNVIGILPGTSAAKDYFLFTAHWDHLGHCDAVNGDDICNGALDNASGIAGLVALAEANAKTGRARRSLVFMALTCEECGLLGSRYYADHPVYPLAHTVGGVNMDVLNVSGRTKDSS